MVHTLLEEEIFYPACTNQVKDEDLVEEAYVEHDGAKVLIAELLQGSPSDEFYDAKVTVLSEMIKHHVKEEEKRSEGLFAQARDAGLDVDALGEQMASAQGRAVARFPGRRRPAAAGNPLLLGPKLSQDIRCSDPPAGDRPSGRRRLFEEIPCLLLTVINR